MPDQATIEHDVKQFLALNFPLAGDEELGPDDSLLAAGVIDSTGVLELIEFLEERYEIKITDEEVLPENLDSIGAIGRFLAGKLQRGDVAAGEAV